MQWLTPLVGLYAAGVAIPLLLLLYFLKLKRQEAVVSSTLLWKRAVQDLQVNAPFQKLRRNILLLLQLLALIAMLVALAGPILALSRGSGQRYVLLIDRSASMNATDVEPTRLAEAKKQARTFIESLRSGSVVSLRDASDHAMVIAFDRHAKVMCNFTSDKRQLMAAVDAIAPSDGTSRLGEAVTVARAFAQAPGVEGAIRTAEAPAQLVLFSDGRIGDLETIVVGSDELVFHKIGQAQDNVAVTVMNARRSYEQPEQVEVFASLANYGTEPVTRDVQLGINGDVRAVRSVRIPALEAGAGDDPPKPGRVAVNFSLTQREAGVLELRHLGNDLLAADDAAWGILEPPKKLSVLLVTEGNPVLESALEACPIERLDPCTPSGFDAMDPNLFLARRQYDVVVLDNHVPRHTPRCRYLVFGRPPSGIDVNVVRQLDSQIVVDWRAQHPVLQYVNLTNLFAAKAQQLDLPRDAEMLAELDLPRDAEMLAEFNDSPALAVLRRKGSTYLLAGFDILESNWPFEPSFILFCYNALNYLAAQADVGRQRELAVGEPITIEDIGSQRSVTVTRPDNSEVTLKPDPGGAVRFPGTQRVGLYGADVSGQPTRAYAVNMLDADESRIEPQEKIEFSSVSIAAEDGAVQRANVPLWPALVLMALVIACLEWLAYNAKVKI
jgi:hypothetical protein